MNGLYLDNAATSFPKAPGVADAVAGFLSNSGCNINRGLYTASYEAANIVYETRELLSNLFNFPKPENVIFTKNITESLNVILKGLLKSGDHVLISSMEHNAVMRPLASLAEKGVEVSTVLCNNKGELSTGDLVLQIKSNTKAVIMTHASNVSGTIMPLEEVGQLCKEHNLLFIVDSAQTAGFLSIDFVALKADAFAFTGHKGLLGPQGIGGFYLNDKLAALVGPLIEGGTGSASDSVLQPSYLPDRFEAGTLNLPGIYGLNAALKYLSADRIPAIREKELSLAQRFMENVQTLPGIQLLGPAPKQDRTGIASLNFLNRDNAEVSYQLFKDFGIMTRCGLHCAPAAHRTLGTFPQGTIRFSFSHFNSHQDVDYVIDLLKGLFPPKN
ncbi:aminotransferase class V-fold PLP-dependent enzyme [Desulfosporosinus shakirovi]|uniref:aminotransferase class V-fold PLP-dependent enzyme n=1 Tax=Desulfosporosinus shakirovi TaxID=2885154 RepID=UPI001E41BD13|nr:aminotransferase class V-fold PLP-dependent enzyme [Desulfosporosinus sp. SRJS8]MCB8814622.1 aminotransferase class V-fold PLP-dependent enzyme [Desulfosporosinus sp. SRJS8]